MADKHEDSPPNVVVPALHPPPSDLVDAVPPIKPDTTPVSATPDRTDEILAAVAGLDAKLETVRLGAVERDRMLADSIMNSNAKIRDEINVKLDGVVEATRQALDGSHRWLSEWANQNAYETDKKWDARSTKLEGELKALAKVVEDGFTASSKQIDKLARLVGSVLTHVVQSGGQRIDDAEGTKSDAFESEATTRSG